MSNAIIPIPKIPITIRPATPDDLPFIDGLQKMHSKQVGFLHRQALEGKIKAGHVLVAEDVTGHSSLVTCQREETAERPFPPSLTSDKGQVTNDTRVGYCIGHDQYFKRDDVGVIYQMNVAPGHQRGFVGAMLLKALFDRAAYGCRLFCCWCAQDIEANRFWEAMGFVPLAFRTGSRNKERVHIFWQKRIREGDATTPWWFPSKTSSGSIREDRLVFPIPPGTHWSDAKPVILPALSGVEGPGEETALPALEDKTAKRPRPRVKVKAKAGTIGFSALRFAKDVQKEDRQERADRRRQGQKMKNDPQHERMARQLRDVFLERANADPSALIAAGKYDLCRQLIDMPELLPATPAVSAQVVSTPHLLPAA